MSIIINLNGLDSSLDGVFFYMPFFKLTSL